MKLRLLVSLISLFFLTSVFSIRSVSAAPLRVAVSANFKPVLETLVEKFEQEKGHKVQVSSASTGILFNQITHGAPFDVFFSADQARPVALEEKQLILSGSRKVYAYGRLALWDRDKGHASPINLSDLKSWKGRVAIANPATAPYGLAAQQTMEKLGVWQQFQGRLIQGASIQQTWQFVASGNVSVGLVALSQLSEDELKRATVIDERFYQPIRQEMVILKRSKKPEEAALLAEFILSPDNQKYIAEHGYRAANKAI